MRIYNPFRKEFKTVSVKEDNHDTHLKYETRRYKGKFVVMRVWYNGWFPLNPVKGFDIRGKDWNKV